MFWFSACKELGGIFAFPLPFVMSVWHTNTVNYFQLNLFKTIPRFKTLMTNKTEHDGHGSKTVEISDMKYNIFKVWDLIPLLYFFFIFSTTWKVRQTQVVIS